MTFDDCKVIKINPGMGVFCDICHADYTQDNSHGGFFFAGKGVCPKCAPRFKKSIIECNEEKFIKAECPPYSSFRDFIYTLREQGY